MTERARKRPSRPASSGKGAWKRKAGKKAALLLEKAFQTMVLTGVAALTKHGVEVALKRRAAGRPSARIIPMKKAGT